MSSISWNIGYIPYKHNIMHPDKTAVIFEDEPVTYRQLNEGINRCAHMLQAKGMGAAKYNSALSGGKNN